MITVNARPGAPILLGREGENLVRQVVFDVTEWRETYGEGTIRLIAQRMGDADPYPCVVEVDGTKVVWVITNADTAKPGNYGKCELSYHIGERLAKSETWQTIVIDAMGEAIDEAPEPQQAWVDMVLDAAERAEEAAERAENSGGSGSGGSTEIPEDVEKRLETLESQMAELLYEAIAISSFSHNAGTKEMGSTLTAVTLAWATNKIPSALTLDGTAIDTSLTSTTLSGLSITATKTWTLKATDERDATATKTTTVSFQNGIYYGASAVPDTIDSAFILGLSKKLSSGKYSPVTVNVADGQYAWYCLPTRIGTCTFTVGGFEGGFDLVDTIAFTNASGYTENYYVYRSSNASLGSTKVVVT